MPIVIKIKSTYSSIWHRITLTKSMNYMWYWWVINSWHWQKYPQSIIFIPLQWNLSLFRETTAMKDQLSQRTNIPGKGSTLQYQWTCQQRPSVLTDHFLFFFFWGGCLSGQILLSDSTCFNVVTWTSLWILLIRATVSTPEPAGVKARPPPCWCLWTSSSWSVKTKCTLIYIVLMNT